MLPGMDTRFAVNGDVRLAYDDLGPPGADPLLMVMGLGASRFWWPPGLLDCLREHGFRPAVLDLRDAGESSRATRRYATEDLADDAAAVLEALGWQTAHVFGMSFGGVIAQRLALRHPARVRTLTTFAAGPSDAGLLTVMVRYLRWGRQLRPLRLTRRTPDDTALAEGILAVAATPAYPAEEGTAGDAVARDRSHGIRSFRDMAAQSRQTRARWHGPPLRELRAPALIICGGADPLMRPRASRDTAAAIPGARLLVLPGVGHLPPRPVWPVIAAEMRALADRQL
jgi:pimeloyl-ACP methyl ester carboxylesterase